MSAGECETLAQLEDKNKTKKGESSPPARQASIMEMFKRKPKRKASATALESICKTKDTPTTTSEETCSRDGKRARIDQNVMNGEVVSNSDKENIQPSKDSKPASDQQSMKSDKKVESTKCRECRQHLTDVKLFPGDPPGSEEEFVVLTHESLALFVGNEETGRPQHKITDFTVYDKSTHVCSFDSGLVERNVELFFSGVIKPVYDEDSSTDNGVPGSRFGPINEWWTAGFDGGERALVGFSTAFADYYLMEPSVLYKEHWSSVQEKIYMSKNVIEFLSDNPAAAYEDLVNRIQTTVPPPALGLNRFTEDSLLRHAQFVVEQVESYDSARTDDEDSLLGTPCMRDLIHLAGVTLGKRRAARRTNIMKEKKHVKASSTKATTTHLVAEIMEQFFQGTVDASTGSKIRRRRCGVCEACLRPECGKCPACRDMVKFGGKGTAKQTCVQRKCPNLGIELDDEPEPEPEIDDVAVPEKPKQSPHKAVKAKKSIKAKARWNGESVLSNKTCSFYASVQLGENSYDVGDCVSVLSDTPEKQPFIGRIVYLFEEESSGEKMVHLDWFLRATESILQEVADPGELLLVDDCENVGVECIHGRVEVFHRSPHPDWFAIGGVADDRKFPKCDGVSSFFYQKWYDSTCARFLDPPVMQIPDDVDYCPACDRHNAKIREANPVARDELRSEDTKVYYGKAAKDGVEYCIGDCAYLPVEAFSFSNKLKTPQKKQLPKTIDEIDEDEYPEYYRKGSYVKGSNETVAKPFRIARITSIFCNNVKKSGGKINMTVTKFYRPENTHKSVKSTYFCDLNLLYWTDEEVTLDFDLVEGKCRVECEYDLTVPPAEYSRNGADRFYFSQAYNAKEKEFYDPPMQSRRTGVKQMIQDARRCQTKMTKLTKVKLTKSDAKKDVEMMEESQQPYEKLRCLDVFSGCGGLSEGFHQAGITNPAYAIELWEPAAQAYRLNNPGATVFTEDCNVLLEMVMTGQEKSSCGQRLPQKGDVDLLCGGPPCQGFSGMNRFNSREYSRFKNSLVVSYLSYCDYFRPRFFLLENVRNFVSYKNCMVLKLALASLLRMGYQCTFGILQAGHYGVAQTRRRAIILAAAPGEQLPLYPEPLHTFSTRGGSLSAQIGDQRYSSNIKRLTSAPFRTITVRDTMSDLPKIPNGHAKLEISYRGESESQFQRMIRAGGYQAVLRDHICKEMSPLVAARMGLIPRLPGSDWRDLPNKVVKLSDGSMTKLLRYDYKDKKQGKSSTGALRGVCSCAEGKSCDPLDRQFNTLIPWCLPHTGNRHNHWAGLYGRLGWDGFFSTTVTNPEPMGKQGRVLHPEQNRVVSVRECARSQGFPDSYRFFGTILDKHREVGNAVPPPMAKAIGLEIKKCLQWKQLKKIKSEELPQS
uniref:DNA (cytosine-5)-methyltransferase n=1 Tax=Phallusia mammillata TaxID=59560 RepID=A0A6F9DC22_9ASCI|nr:DNA (cytosine-5)-methyltransferase 1 [Phallusia mammillata]